ncbi:hypothetical protein [Micromonospora sp. DT47]|uniref:hypothetical protein n=1 Tax=Micromonospora sp. DT47 TaxID=3393431 RepID=UPI003CE89C66
MNAHRMDQETAERLLGGPVVDPQGGQEPLVALLAAVRAAPRPAELRGENAAMHAFRSARAGAPLPMPTRTAQPGALARLAGLKVALAALAVAATGGVALAAATGTLPAPPHRPANPPVTPSAAPGQSSSTTARPGPSGAPSTVDPGRSAPSASTVGLCRAYRADAGDNPGRTLDNPAFAALINSAGGRDKVSGYCERVVGEYGTSGKPDTPATGRPAGRPSHSPTTPAGKPTAPAPTELSGPGVH